MRFRYGALVACLGAILVCPNYSDAADASSGSGGLVLEEIVVTAEKRSESLLDVPIPISVLTGDFLEAQKLDSIADLADYVPGLSVSSGGSPGQRAIVLRGLATSVDQSEIAPLVATYIDDEPVGATNGFAARGAQYGIDLMPYDLERIEVLKGPQGTLYGADAMGGIVKYTLKKPDLTQFEARVGADLQNVDGAGNEGWNGRAAVNVPIIVDTLALRVSGVYQRNPGFIDNLGTGIKDANKSTESGGRAALLWKATDRLSLQLNVLAQNISSDDVTGVSYDAATQRLIYGPNERFSYFPEGFDQQLRDYSLHIDWDLGFATLTSSSSWSHMSSEKNQDLSPGNYLYPVASINNLFFDDQISKFTEEARLTSPDSQRVQWMLGALYTREYSNEPAWWPAYAPPASTPASTYVPLPAPYNNLLDQDQPGTYAERAIFGNATYKVTERFDVGGGVRYAQDKASLCWTTSGPFENYPADFCGNRPYQGRTTWMGTSRFHLTPEAMLYARVATGYRPGGGYAGTGNPALHVPDFYYSDSIINYELGFKGELLNHRLQVDASLFYIDWSNIQISIPNNGFPYLGNGGTAVSRGVELTTSYAMTRNLRLNATLDFTDAHLTENAPGVGGVDGDQLPISPRWTASLSGDYSRSLDEKKTLLMGASYRYRDMIINEFAGLGPTLPMPPQNIVDVYTGLQVAQAVMRLYAKNVFNNRSYTGTLYLVDPTKPMFVPIQPRTIGLSVDYKF